MKAQAVINKTPENIFKEIKRLVSEHHEKVGEKWKPAAVLAEEARILASGATVDEEETKSILSTRILLRRMLQYVYARVEFTGMYLEIITTMF